MKEINFAHISDIHFCCDGSSDFVKMVNKKYNPLDKLRLVLKNMPKIDFILLTGDIVHDGEAEDYKRLRDIFSEYLPDTPIYCSMGNHDRADNFRKGFLGKEVDGKPYYDVFHHGDLRIITLDSAYHYGMKGYLCREQCDFLKKELSENYGRGTFIITHHPFKCAEKASALTSEYDLGDVIDKSDVIAFFNGHVHINTMSFFHKRLHITGESMSFGIEPVLSQNIYAYTEKNAWNECSLNGTELTLIQHAVSPNYTILKTKSM